MLESSNELNVHSPRNTVSVGLGNPRDGSEASYDSMIHDKREQDDK